MTKPHDMDPFSSFCLRCGAGAVHIVNDRLPCADSENIVAISHILSRRRFAEIVDPAIARLAEWT